mmetsp:Transcript_9734/g.27234  ORF Transcript_9734/g.27234 Transcript_9734/m.27234 type:complete len:147 (-) Transcript_9734:231-671(-)
MRRRPRVLSHYIGPPVWAMPRSLATCCLRVGILIPETIVAARLYISLLLRIEHSPFERLQQEEQTWGLASWSRTVCSRSMLLLAWAMLQHWKLSALLVQTLVLKLLLTGRQLIWLQRLVITRFSESCTCSVRTSPRVMRMATVRHT